MALNGDGCLCCSVFPNALGSGESNISTLYLGVTVSLPLYAYGLEYRPDRIGITLNNLFNGNPVYGCLAGVCIDIYVVRGERKVCGLVGVRLNEGFSIERVVGFKEIFVLYNLEPYGSVSLTHCGRADAAVCLNVAIAFVIIAVYADELIACAVLDHHACTAGISDFSGDFLIALNARADAGRLPLVACAHDLNVATVHGNVAKLLEYVACKVKQRFINNRFAIKYLIILGIDRKVVNVCDGFLNTRPNGNERTYLFIHACVLVGSFAKLLVLNAVYAEIACYNAVCNNKLEIYGAFGKSIRNGCVEATGGGLHINNVRVIGVASGELEIVCIGNVKENTCLLVVLNGCKLKRHINGVLICTGSNNRYVRGIVCGCVSYKLNAGFGKGNIALAFKYEAKTVDGFNPDLERADAVLHHGLVLAVNAVSRPVIGFALFKVDVIALYKRIIEVLLSHINGVDGIRKIFVFGNYKLVRSRCIRA